MKKFFNEFKEFITRGNVLDMAIGVIIATAFGKITTSLVGDVFMPLIGYLIGGIDLSALNITLSPPCWMRLARWSRRSRHRHRHVPDDGH